MPTTPPTISSFSQIPNRSVPSTFESKGDTFLTELTTFVTQTNNALANIETNTNELVSSQYISNTQNTIGYGEKTFELDGNTTNKGVVFLKATSLLDSTKFMSGIVIGYPTYNSNTQKTTVRIYITELDGLGEVYEVWGITPCSEPVAWGSSTAPNPTTPAPMGSWWFDENHFYFCIRDNTWRRTALSTW